VRPSGTDPAEGNYLFILAKPKMDGLLVIVIEVLIYAVLLHDEDLTADPQEFVKFV
jgi:hypothetical protein